MPRRLAERRHFRRSRFQLGPGEAPETVAMSAVLPDVFVDGPRARDVLRPAFRTYRERFARVAGTAFVVFGALAAIDALATVLILDHLSRPVGVAIASTISAIFAMVGVVVYAGVL